jgi:ATP-dependent protease ClpP protease subunit
LTASIYKMPTPTILPITTGEDDFKTTRIIGNEMFFYSDVTSDDILEFTEDFKKLENKLLKQTIDFPGFKPEIRINICSDGGEMFAGLSAMNVIEKSRVKVVTIAQGACCSAASFMLLGGHERRMGKNAHILIHQLSTNGFWGKFEDLKNEMDSCSKFMDMITKVYLEKTEIPEKEFKKLMKKDIYLNVEECLKYNVVSSID